MTSQPESVQDGRSDSGGEVIGRFGLGRHVPGAGPPGGGVWDLPRWLRASATVLAVPVAVALRFALVPFIGWGIPYITLFPVTVAVALFAGMRVVILTGIIGSVAIDYFFIPPLHAVEVSPEGIFRIAVVTLTSVFVGSVGASLRSARRRAEERTLDLRVSEERLAFALETSGIGAWDVDLSDNSVQRSREHDRIFGYESLLPRWTYDMFLEHVVPEDRPVVDDRFRTATAAGTNLTLECRIRRADGEIRWIWAAGRHRSGGADGARTMSGIVQDITDRKREQEALAEREHSLREARDLLEAVTEGSEELIVAVDTDFRYVLFNNVYRRELERLTGADIAIGDSVIDMLAGMPERQELSRALWRRGMAGETVRETVEVRDPRSGESRVYSVRLAPIKDVEGRIIGAGQTATDVTAQVRADEEHRQTRDYLENLFSHANAPIIFWDSEFRITRFNRAFERLTGRPADDVLGRHLELLFPVDRREVALSHIRRAVAGELWDVVELNILHVDGSVRTLLWNSAPLYAADGHTIVATIAQGQDITEREEAQAALRRARDELEERVAERTAELDRIVAALTVTTRQLRKLASELTIAEQRERQRLALVLHDNLQQLLVGALIQSVPLQRSADPGVSKAAIDLSETVREALVASRSLTAELSPPVLQHGGLIGALRWLAGWMLEKHDLAIELDLDEDAAPRSEVVSIVLFEAVRELLFNVVKHAGVKQAYVDARRIDRHIHITVKDDGVGIDPAGLRPEDNLDGGLGLVSVMERLASLGGRMEITSAPGCGSTVDLTIPIEPPGPRSGGSS